jgi:Leucine-rich repeat (LRR) protein
LSGEDGGYDDGWWCAPPKTDFAEARGNVDVYPGMRLGLALSCDADKDFSPLADLPPGAIEAIWVNCGDNLSKPGDAPLAAIAKMTGLKMLTLFNAGVTAAGISQLANLQSLERVSIFEKELEDTVLDTIARLRSLRYLHIWRDYSLPGDRLCKLAKLPSLQYLSLCEMDLFACKCLIEFPALQILRLDAGNGFVSVDYLDGLSNGGLNNAGLNNIHTLDIYNLSDEQFAALHEMPSVKKLSIQGKGYEYTAKGFANLSRLPQLESLKVYGRYRDEAIAAMPPLPHLKELCLGGLMQDRVDYLTDATLAHLAQFQSLESLEISIGQFTEEGLGYLSRLSNLKVLSIPNNMALTDAGMAQLGKCSRLEYLTVRASKITDAGLAQLEGLPQLKELELYCGRESAITDKAIARLKEKIPALTVVTSPPRKEW